MKPEDLEHLADESKKGLPEKAVPAQREARRERGPKVIKTRVRHIMKF